MKDTLRTISAGRDLTRSEAHALFDAILSGGVEPAMMGAVLGALATKGESIEEITGAAEVMREKVTPVRCSATCIDTCGTGGDGISTFNVSTTAALIAAAAGATVAKHGNTTNTRVSGSAEVMAQLGINLEAGLETIERCLAEARIAFLFAVKFHPGMKHAAPVRKALGIRTIFNLLGPLTNPAGATRQVLGVNRPELTEKLAIVLRNLGSEHAMIVHGTDGLCDFTITGETRITELRDGRTTTYNLRPESVRLSPAKLRSLQVDSPEASATAIREILSGQPGPRRDHAVLNAGAAVYVAGLAKDLEGGVRRAEEVLDDGRAAQTLDKLVELSNA